MVKRDMKKALGASLKAEEQAVKSRFEKANAVSLQTPPALREPPQPKAAVQVIRDNSNVPSDEDELLSRIKQRCIKAGINADKSEVLKAGLAALDAMRDRELERLFANLRRAKTGRIKRKILTFVIQPADVVKFRRRAQLKRFQFTRQLIIGRRIATVTRER
jgi:hypothetical protein